jgi:hypothetical protein
LVVSRSILHVNSSAIYQNLSQSFLNAMIFIAIAFIPFTLHEIEQCPVFFWDTRYKTNNFESYSVKTPFSGIITYGEWIKMSMSSSWKIQRYIKWCEWWWWGGGGGGGGGR